MRSSQDDDDAPPGPKDPTLFEAGPGLFDGPSPGLDDDGFRTRYEMKSLLGEGGMGEVRLCVDHRMGREIAMKMVRGGHSDWEVARAQFLHEARIQARLEHPAIVPVHDLGAAAADDLFFTMRRVHGESLDVVITRLRNDERAALERWSRRRLLSAFSRVCAAIDYAHSRGVIHRDLKPSNIMLGEFGEVYVLDWGCATTWSPTPDVVSRPSVPTPSGIVGTPGYIAPEILRATIEEPGPRADVYALGAILFEILALEPLFPRGSSEEMLRAARAGVESRPSVRNPDADVDPGLDAIVARATALDPLDRYPSARALHDAIEAWLDGDRDHELRRTLAAKHATEAEAEADRALASGGHTQRQAAMRAVGRALALDPGNPIARRALVRLTMEPPRELPPEAIEALDRQQVDRVKVAARAGGFAYASCILYIPLLFLMGVRNWPLIGTMLATVFAAAGVGFVIARMRPNHRLLRAYVLLAVTTVAMIAVSRVFGPYMLVPSIVAISTVAFTLVAVDRSRPAVLAFGCLGVAAPVALEWLGVLPASYSFEGNVMQVLPQMVALPALPTQAFLAFSSLAIIVTGYVVVGSVRDALDEAERRVFLHAWHMKSLLPATTDETGS